MTLHLLKLIWNRKRANFLIVTEILLSFIVLASVTTVAVHYYRNYQAPLGFSHDRIWDVNVRVPRGLDSTPEADRDRLQRVLRLIEATRAMPEVESVSTLQMGPFRNWEWNSDFQVKGGRRIEFNGNRADDKLAETMSIAMLEGRWFSREDTGMNYEPVVLNRRMARDVFGEGPVVGKTLPSDENRRPDRPAERPRRVVGVIEDFRQFGEYSTLKNYLLMRNDIVTEAARPIEPAAAPGTKQPPREESRGELPNILVVRVRPGVTAEFEERLVKALQVLAPDWSFAMQPLSDIRTSYLRNNYLTPLVIMAMIAGFLLVMVALGLSGVLWQNVTQRIRELGLRRAKGADRVRIKRQIFMEIALMTGIALTVGAIVLAQVPVLGWLGPVPKAIYAVSLALSGVMLFLLTSFCGWYPSLLATRIPPAEALRYE